MFTQRATDTFTIIQCESKNKTPYSCR